MTSSARSSATRRRSDGRTTGRAGRGSRRGLARGGVRDLHRRDRTLWWRRDTPYWNDRERGLTIRIEPRVGGRFLEIWDLESGTCFEVGRVTVWDPGVRLA